MARPINPLYLIRLRRQIKKLDQPVNTTARMSGVAQPILHRFLKGEQQSLNEDTANRLMAYLETKTNEKPVESIVKDVIEYHRQISHWFEQQLRDCPENERELLLEYQDRYLCPMLKSYENIVQDLIPELEKESQRAQELSRRPVPKANAKQGRQRRTTRKAKDGN